MHGPCKKKAGKISKACLSSRRKRGRHAEVWQLKRVSNIRKWRSTRDNGKIQPVEPEPTANGFSFLVNESTLVWKGENILHSGISFFCDHLQVNRR